MNKPQQLDDNTFSQAEWNLPEISAPVLYDSGKVVDLEAHARGEANADPSRPLTSATEPNSVEEMVIGSSRSQQRHCERTCRQRPPGAQDPVRADRCRHGREIGGVVHAQHRCERFEHAQRRCFE